MAIGSWDFIGLIAWRQLAAGDDHMTNMDVGAWRPSEVSSQSYSNTAIKPDGAVTSFDDGMDFPPTDHPFRELVTFSIFASSVVGLLVWGGLKLL
jgi:hypothetical protein